MTEYVELHLHRDRGSLLDGLGTGKEYVTRAVELGMPALGMADHGSLSAAYEHWKLCRQAGIKPIIGCEFYVAPESRFTKERVRWGNAEVSGDADVSGSGAYTHLTVVAQNPTGLRNLFRLQQRAYSEGFYRKPRIDLELLAEHHSGLIVLSGCAGGAISTRLRLGQEKEADNLVRWFKEHFGENFFVEVMSHGLSWEAQLNEKLVALAERHSVDVVATNDVHYCAPEHSSVHAAFLCIQTGSTLSAPVFKFDGQGYHLRSGEEMATLELPDVAIRNTLVVADRVESYDSVFAHQLRFPQYPMPDGYTSEEVLRQLAEEGITGKSSDYYQRLTYELDVICGMGYPDYFLVLSDIIKAAKAEGIRVGPGRGSAGGSLVAYALGITELDPIAHGLLFERFLNPERVSLPDIDIDIQESKRDRFIEIAVEKYGREHVAQLGTIGTIGAKAALKDANRVLGGTFAEGNRRTAMLPPAKFGRQPGLDEYTGPKDDTYQLAVPLEGRVRNHGIHAAAVAFSPVPMVEVLPVRYPGGTGPMVTDFDMHEVEALGLVKMDFLGLRNLDVLNETLRTLRARQITPALPVVPDDCSDPRTYKLLSRGDTLGVFQLDGTGMRELLRSLKPTGFNDISAVLALYRPGPMGANSHTEFARRKNSSGGQWRAEWAIHPELEASLKPTLAPTYGLIVFQEQVMEALKTVCGWSYAEAGLLFDAMRKKNHEKMAATKPAYEAAGRAKGYSPEALAALWETLVPFADYSFNRSHTAGYGLVAYWTAYLKANFPTEYMSALLTSVSEDKDRLPEYLAECQRMGIAILSPDINRSGVGFSPGKGMSIHYGLSAIKGVGEKAYAAIERKRPYRSLDDWFRRAPATALNAGTLGTLVKAGAMDSLTPLREELFVAHESLTARALRHRQELRNGQLPLSGLRFEVGQSGLYNLNQRLQWEMETLSTVVTQATITLAPTRLLDEPELVWLRSVVESSPGIDRLELKFGRAVVKLPSVNWGRLEPVIRANQAFEVEQ